MSLKFDIWIDFLYHEVSKKQIKQNRQFNKLFAMVKINMYNIGNNNITCTNVGEKNEKNDNNKQLNDVNISQQNAYNIS